MGHTSLRKEVSTRSAGSLRPCRGGLSRCARPADKPPAGVLRTGVPCPKRLFTLPTPFGACQPRSELFFTTGGSGRVTATAPGTAKRHRQCRASPQREDNPTRGPTSGSEGGETPSRQSRTGASAVVTIAPSAARVIPIARHRRPGPAPSSASGNAAGAPARISPRPASGVTARSRTAAAVPSGAQTTLAQRWIP